MINVLQVTTQMDYGGVASVVRNLYAAMDHGKVHFDYVSHGGPEDYHASVRQDGSEIYYFETVGKLGVKGYAAQIAEKLDVRKYDIIHLHIGDLNGLYARAFRRCGAKLIVSHAHETMPHSRLRGMMEPVFRHLAVKESDLCIACGRMAGEFIFGKGRFELLPNGIDASRFERISEDRIKVLSDRFGTAGRKVAVAVGNYLEVKNQSFLLEAAAELKKSIDNLLVIFAGEGPLRPALEEKIAALGLEGTAVLAGTVSDIPALLKLADAFALPSLHEGIPVSAVEAQAAAVPALISDTVDRGVDIGNGCTYFLPIDKGPQLWAEKLGEVLTGGIRPDALSVPKRLAESGYDIKTNAARLTDMYAALISKNSQ